MIIMYFFDILFYIFSELIFIICYVASGSSDDSDKMCRLFSSMFVSPDVHKSEPSLVSYL